MIFSLKKCMACLLAGVVLCVSDGMSAHLEAVAPQSNDSARLDLDRDFPSVSRLHRRPTINKGYNTIMDTLRKRKEQSEKDLKELSDKVKKNKNSYGTVSVFTDVAAVGRVTGLDYYQKLIRMLEEKNRKLNERIGTLEKQLMENNDKITKLQKLVKNMEALQGKLVETKAQLARSEGEKADLANMFNGLVAEMQGVMDSLDAQILYEKSVRNDLEAKLFWHNRIYNETIAMIYVLGHCGREGFDIDHLDLSAIDFTFWPEVAGDPDRVDDPSEKVYDDGRTCAQIREERRHAIEARLESAFPEIFAQIRQGGMNPEQRAEAMENVSRTSNTALGKEDHRREQLRRIADEELDQGLDPAYNE